MSLNGPRAPLSPISVGGSEWSVSKYQGDDRDGPYPNARPTNLASPPPSGGSLDIMNMSGFPSAPRSVTGGPSPPPSIGGRSSGANYGRADSLRNSGRPSTASGDIDEPMLSEHYRALKAFLQARDPNAKAPPNKARDKLLRLSSVQFFELSTDVFDELMRRQAAARANSRQPGAPPNNPGAPPTFLLPEKNFHPKRNQARQRLSSLGPPRFRDLAADVFHELERRFPRFAGGEIPRGGSGMSNRSGPGFPRAPGAMRRPSDASSIRAPFPSDLYGVPPSPGLPPGDYGRPMAKQLNQSNTIVPIKSTMVEDDSPDDDGQDAYMGNANRQSKRSATSGTASETDKKLIEDYQSQVRELREKLDEMEDGMKKKEDELSSALDQERSRSTAAESEKREWDDLRRDLEKKVADAQNLNDSMTQELERMREDYDEEARRLRNEMDDLRQQAATVVPVSVANPELERENEELRQSLEQQQQVTEQVRREAQQFLLEMKGLSQQSTTTYERQLELEKTVEQLEGEVQEWRNRYARTKTQLRDMRASSPDSIGLDESVAKHLKDKGFVGDTGLVKDVHVTKFQIAIDELVQRARSSNAESVIEAMKLVIGSVRRITKDLDEATPQHDDEITQRLGKMKAKVSFAANGLITTSKNFAASAGMAPVSLVDAAASNLSAAVVELLRLAKIRVTPAAELEEDDEDDVISPMGSTNGFYSQYASDSSISQNSLPPPPPFQGLGGMRASADSSMYSPINSPRESLEPRPLQALNGNTNGANRTNGNAYTNGNGNYNTMDNGYGAQSRDNQMEDLRIRVSDQAAVLVSDIQNLVSSIREDRGIDQIMNDIRSIDGNVGKIIMDTNASGNGNLVARLDDCRERLLEAGEQGEQLAQQGVKPADRDWRMWAQILPPIAFEVNRETKELLQRLDRFGGADEFS